MRRKLIFILFFLFISCSEEEEEKTEILYPFPPLSKGQLIDLKKESEKIEGFFVTTDLSDLDSSYAERGFYLYVCIRFLNDQTVNNKLKKSAIPLLVQVSNHQDKPEAESLLLFHPKTVKPDKNGIFYYEERQSFKFTDSSMIIKDKEYNIFDVTINEKSKITELSFIKKGTKLEDLNRAVSGKDTENSENEEENSEDDDSTHPTEENNEEANKKDLILGVTAFAKQFSSSCENWAFLNYKHSKDLPGYLQVSYSNGNGEDSTDNGSNKKGQKGSEADSAKSGAEEGSSSTSNPNIPTQTPIPENTPHTPAPQI